MFRTQIVLIALSSLATLLSVSGCVASLQADPGYVEVSSVPANIEVYPHEYYEGRTVYLVNDNWYYRDGARWVYYSQEPAPLNQRRMYIQQAPSASRRYSAPPSAYIGPVNAAPPAQRGQRVRSDDNHAERDSARPAARPAVAPPARRVQNQRSNDSHADRRENRGSER